MQPDQYQHNTNEDSNRDHLANERCVMFLDLRFDERIQSAVNLGHGCFLPATLIAPRASGVLLFQANRLRVQAKLSQ
jgi:predicted adenine nucleotide alpha hydrolase (AANH) superfamily ATPase